MKIAGGARGRLPGPTRPEILVRNPGSGIGHQLANLPDQPKTPIATRRIANPKAIQDWAARELRFHSPVKNPTQLAVTRLTTKLSGQPMAGPSFPSFVGAAP